MIIIIIIIIIIMVVKRVPSADHSFGERSSSLFKVLITL